MFFQITLNVFLAFFIIPFSSGTLYKAAAFFASKEFIFSAKILGIFLALCINYFIGFAFGKLMKNKKISGKINNFLPIFSFIPVISGIICFYLGATKFSFFKFILIALSVNFVYYLLALYYPVLGIYF